MFYWLLLMLIPWDHPNLRKTVSRLSILPFEQPLFFLMRLIILFNSPTLPLGILDMRLLFRC
jgi:hypothetical protein